MRFAIKLLSGKREDLEKAIGVIEEATGRAVPDEDPAREAIAALDDALMTLRTEMAKRAAEEGRANEPETTPQTPSAKRGRGRPRKAPAAERTLPIAPPLNGGAGDVEIPIEETEAGHA